VTTDTDFRPTHYGLLFSQEQLASAVAAWAQRNTEGAATPPEPRTALGHALLLGLEHRWRGAPEAAHAAIVALEHWRSSGTPLAANEAAGLAAIVSQVQAHEMVWEQAGAGWSARFIAGLVDALDATPAPGAPMDRLWGATAAMAVAIAADDAGRFGQAVAFFHEVLAQWVHPDGYIRPLVAPADGHTFMRSILGAKALVLMAEMAFHAGTDLWSVEQRGVSVGTTLPYLIYYNGYPEKWRWEPGYDRAWTLAAFRESGAFMEIANYRLAPRACDTLLDEQRPMFDALGGGWTSLTHGNPAPRRRGMR
jgi:hypothetical protein